MKTNKKTISKEKLLNILKYVGIALAAVLVLGLVGSLFAGNSGGGDGVKAPSGNRPSTENTEVTDVSSDEGSSESSTEAPTVPEVTSNYRLNFDSVRTNSGFDVISTSGFSNESVTLDFGLIQADSTRSLSLQGWFMTEGGVSEYRIEIHDQSGEAPDTVMTFEGQDRSSDESFLGVADKYGFGTDALLGCRFYINSINLTSYNGKTVDVYFYALTNNGREILLSTFTNVTVAKEITFTIFSESYTAIEGMTWAEWCASEYNTDEFYVNADEGNRIYRGIGYIGGPTSYEPVGSDFIIADFAYGH